MSEEKKPVGDAEVFMCKKCDVMPAHQPWRKGTFDMCLACATIERDAAYKMLEQSLSVEQKYLLRQYESLRQEVFYMYNSQ